MVVNATLHFVWLQLSPWEPGPLNSPVMRFAAFAARGGLALMRQIFGDFGAAGFEFGLMLVDTTNCRFGAFLACNGL